MGATRQKLLRKKGAFRTCPQISFPGQTAAATIACAGEVRSWLCAVPLSCAVALRVRFVELDSSIASGAACKSSVAEITGNKMTSAHASERNR